MAENMNTFGVGTTDTLNLDDLNTTLVEDKEVDELPEEEVENNEVDVVEETPIVETPEPKKEFDVRGAFNFLVNDRGYSRTAAERLVAKNLARRAGVSDSEFNKMLSTGFSSSDIISRYTGLRNPSDMMAFAEGVNREGLRQTPAMALAVKAAQYGFKAPLPLPAKILTSAVFGAGGYLVGLLGGKSVEEMVLPSTGVVPSKTPSLEAGRTVGGLLAGTPATLAAFRDVPKIVNFGSERLLKNIATINGRDKTLKEKALQKTGKVLEFFEEGVKATRNVAINNPKAFVAGESVFAVPAGVGALVAEQTSPGEILPRIGAEIGFSMFFPQKILVNALPILQDNMNKVLTTAKTLNVADVKSNIAVKSAKKYFDNIREAVEKDPANYEQNLINALSTYSLRDVNGNEIKLTPSQITGDVGLALYEKAFLKDSGKFGVEARKAAVEGLNKISSLLKALNDLGTPDALKLAAQLEENTLQSMFKQRLDTLGAEAAAYVEKIAKRGDESIADINIGIKKLVDESLKDWRKIERAAYQAVDKKQIVQTKSLAKTWEDVSENELLKGVTQLDPFILRFLSIYTDVMPSFAPTKALEKVENNILKNIEKNQQKLKSIVDESPEVVTNFNSKVKKDAPDELNQINTLIQGLLKNKTSKGALFTELDSSIRSNLKRYAIARKNIIEKNLELNKVKEGIEVIADTPIEKPATTLKDLMLFRSNLLEKQKQMLAQGNSFEARHYGRFAEAALDDMGVVVNQIDDKLSKGIELSPNEKALNRAFKISRLGNDIFTRAFAGDIARISRTGANKVPPELLSEQLFSGSNLATSIKYDELEKAMELISKRSTDDQIIDLLPTLKEGDGISFQDIRDNIEVRKTNYRSSVVDILKVMAKDVLEDVPIFPGSNETIKVVNPTAVKNFLKKHEGLFELEMLKDLKTDLQNSVNARALFNAFADKKSAVAKSNEQVKLLQKIVKGDNPHEVVSSILSSPYNVESNFNRIINLLNRVAVKDPALAEQARLGLRTTVIDWALDNSRKEIDGLEYFDTLKLNKILTETKKGRPSILNMMKKADIIDNTYIEKFDDLTKALNNIVTSLKTSGQIKDLLADPKGLESAIARIGGAGVGRFLNQILPIGGTIQIPGIGANLAQDFFIAGPKIAVGDFIEQTLAPGNQNLFSAIIEEGLKVPATKGQRKFFNNQALKQFFYRMFGAPSGTVLPVVREVSSEVVPSEALEEPAEVRQVRPPQRETRPPVREMSPQVMAPPPSAPKTDMASRARFQQLFPMDIASQTMTQTAQAPVAPVAPQPMRSGIGSLV
jgi:hypothetical protein